MERKLDVININEYKPLRDIVFETLKDAILKGKLEPKERLMEIQLADQLGVSRTPVREAIRKLELEGLVIMEPRKGAYVSDISYEDIIDTLEVREALETYAVKLAIEKNEAEKIEELESINNEFKKAFEEDDIQRMVYLDTTIHNNILALSGNKKLISFMDALNEIMQRFRLIYFNESYNPESIIVEHFEVFKAIKAGDKIGAVKAMENHLSSLKDDIKKVYKKD
ncbi:MAG: Transcriptional regulator, GntR family [Clostridiales bacterium 38_11]|nr:MAG: Transcriptional regulator, GntR family [Clostridiales bacterium 38_11]HBH13728.1 GntR family transcriptional regulator [Clostridiales bacterium]